MDTATDIHVASAQIQKDIMNHLGLQSNALVFEFSNVDNKIKLDLITINPRHNQSFLFHSVFGFEKIEVLQKMMNYVKNYKEKESSYTIQWIANGDKELHTSYFRASGVYDALDKLYYGRDMNVITVFSVVLNPVA